MLGTPVIESQQNVTLKLTGNNRRNSFPCLETAPNLNGREAPNFYRIPNSLQNPSPIPPPPPPKKKKKLHMKLQ